LVKLYGTANSRAFRSLWMLEELGAVYEHVGSDIANGDTRTPEFLAINPNGHVPVLADGDLQLWESMAINLYLARRFGKAPFWPECEAERARVVQWSFWAVTECEQHGFTVLFRRGGEQFSRWREWTRSEAFRVTHPGAVVPSEASAAAAEAALQAPFRVLNAQLRDRDYILGSAFSAADLNVASVLVSALLARVDLSPHPELAAWLAQCASRPAVAKAAAGRAA
jgi:glutathione S-transferase